MLKDTIKVNAGELQPGMAVQAIVSLSAEYSYLDSRRVARLKQRFAGAKVGIMRGGKSVVEPIETIYAGDHIIEIREIPSDLGFDSIDDETAVFLKEQGFKEFVVLAGEEGEAVTGSEMPKEGTRQVSQDYPRFRSAAGLNHKKSLAEARYFLEKSNEADQMRWKSTTQLQEMFEQGRAGSYSTEPATDLVENILRQDVSQAMAAVAGLKSSDQTYTHCIDMAVLFNEAANAIIRASGKEVADKVPRSTLAAGFMHDIGKSKVPKEILDSDERFEIDSKEMELMRSHVTHSARILSDIGADNTMINVALFHHVKVDTSLPTSYPETDFGKVAPMTRLAAIVDVYQALTGRRSYKKNWVPGKAVEYLTTLKGVEFDEPMLVNFIKVIGKYPLGSLVRLSTGDLGFVIKIEGRPIDRPVVAVVENAKGEILSTNPMADLKEEQDLSITGLLDHYEHYDDFPEQTFQLFLNMKLV